ncbi:MAG: ABC transporter ATP-binding protein [Gammaproteobacteria bacterium]
MPASDFSRKPDSDKPESSHKNNNSTIIQAQGLVRRFGHFTAVDHVDVNLIRGEVFGLLGANGAGKTTTIRLLCGTLPPTDGRITVAGVDMVHHPRRARGRIGYVTQRFTLYSDLQVLENLKLQAGLYGLSGSHKQERINWVLDHLSLASFKHTMAGELPLGYQRRLALAASLLHEPEVLFLDEPTSGVDPIARQHFWELIYDLADAGIGILVTTHYMDEALFCDRIALMHAGKIVAEDTPQHLQQRTLKTPILELRAEDCVSCAQAINSMQQVLETIPHAGQLRIRLESGADSAEVIRKIKSTLQEHRISNIKLEPAAAELEDVFVAVLEEVTEGNSV